MANLTRREQTKLKSSRPVGGGRREPDHRKFPDVVERGFEFLWASADLARAASAGIGGISEFDPHFIPLIRQTANSMSPDVDSQAFETTGLKARANSFDLWNVAVEEVDLLLASRIASYTSRRTVSLA